MDKKEIRQMIKAERKSFREFFKGDAKEYFVDYCENLGPNNLCVCHVIFPGLLSHFNLSMNYLVCRLAECIPVSTVKIWIYRLAGVRIGKRVFISPRTYIDVFYPSLLTIEDDALIGVGASIFVHEYTQKGFRVGRVRIKNGAVIGACSVIRSGVTIGANALVGMASFVNKDVADNTIVGGNPAKPITDNKGQS